MKTEHDAALKELLTFIEEDCDLDEAELDEILAEAGIDFLAFESRLSKDLEQAIGKARLKDAKQSRLDFKSKAKQALDTTVMTVEEKRREIERWLGMQGDRKAVAQFSRHYGHADDGDLDQLLEDIRALQERADRTDEGT